MASGFKFKGADLDSVFAPLHAGWPQASATDFEIGGADVNTRYAPLVTGAAAPATDFKTTGGEDLNQVFAAFGTTGVAVQTQPGNVVGVAAAGNPSGTVTSGVTTCAGTKGKGAYTYTWHIASGSGVTFTAPNSATTAVTGTVPSASTIAGTMYCTISDGTTSVNTNTVSWSLQNTTPQIVVIPYTVSDRETQPTNAGAAILFASDGTENSQKAFAAPVPIGYWDHVGDGTNYDVIATLVSGTAPNTPGFDTLNTWIQVPPNFYVGWSLTNSAGDGSTLSCTIQVQIRSHATHVVESTGNITLNATSNGSQ